MSSGLARAALRGRGRADRALAAAPGRHPGRGHGVRHRRRGRRGGRARSRPATCSPATLVVWLFVDARHARRRDGPRAGDVEPVRRGARLGVRPDRPTAPCSPRSRGGRAATTARCSSALALFCLVAGQVDLLRQGARRGARGCAPTAASSSAPSASSSAWSGSGSPASACPTPSTSRSGCSPSGPWSPSAQRLRSRSAPRAHGAPPAHRPGGSPSDDDHRRPSPRDGTAPRPGDRRSTERAGHRPRLRRGLAPGARGCPSRWPRAAFARGADLAAAPRRPRHAAAARQPRARRPDLDADELDALTAAGLRSYARYWREAFRLPGMDHEALYRRIDPHVEGQEHLERARAQGRGDRRRADPLRELGRRRARGWSRARAGSPPSPSGSSPSRSTSASWPTASRWASRSCP